MILKEEKSNKDCVYNDLSDKSLKEKFCELSLLACKDGNSLSEFINISSAVIKRIYDYSITEIDIETFKKFLKGITLNLQNNNDVFFSFLLYTLFLFKKNENLQVLFINRFLLLKNFSKVSKLYDFLNINSKINLNRENAEFLNLKAETKKEIYSAKIIFSSWEEILFDYVNNINIEKISDRINAKYENLFVFDIDRILFDFENCIFKIAGLELQNDEVEIKKFFKNYKKIVGVSEGLSFEKNKSNKRFKLKIENLADTNKTEEIYNFLKKPNDLFFPSATDKIKAIVNKIIEAKSQNKTVIVDVENEEDLKLLKDYLYIKKIYYSLIDDDTVENISKAAEVLSNSKVTIFSNLIGAFLRPVLGGDFEQIATLKTNSYEIDKKTNFYKEKLKSNLEKEKEKSLNAAKRVLEKGIVIIFASHYIELKNEYLFLNNYFDYFKNEEIAFYNCPEDEIFKKFHFDKVKILNSKCDEKNKFLFEIISKFLFQIKKYSMKKLLKDDYAYLIYIVDLTSNKNTNKIVKIGRNELCYCGSGLKYKNCCGKNESRGE